MLRHACCTVNSTFTSVHSLVHTTTNATRLLHCKFYIHISTFSCSHNDECYNTPAALRILHSHQYILLFTQRRMLRHACCTANSTFTSVHTLVHTTTNATTCLLHCEFYIHINTFSGSHNDECYDTPAVPLTLHLHQYILLFTQQRMLRHACCATNSTFTSVHSLVHTMTNATTRLLCH